MSDRSEVLAEATQHLTWLTTVPHTIDHVVVVARENEQRQRRAAAQAATATGGGGPKASGHSDPTGNAAIALIVESSREITGSIDGALALIRTATAELHHLVADALGQRRWHPPAPHDRAGITSQAVSRLTLITPALDQTCRTLSTAELGNLDHLVQAQIGETSTWLRAKAEGVLAEAPERDREQPVQRAIVECRTCSPWRSGAIAQAGGQCRQCKDFQGHHKCTPTEAIVRRWEISKSATPGMILEAKAASRSKLRRRSA